MNHIGDEHTDLITMALPLLNNVAPTDSTTLLGWSKIQGELSAEVRGWDQKMLLGHDLVLDWGMLGLTIKVCSNTPGRAPTPTEKKAWVVRSTELPHEQVAQIITDYRAPFLALGAYLDSSS
jgi:hypothetical protein